MVKGPVSTCVKRRVVGPVGKQIVTTLIVEHLSDTRGEVVVIVNEEPAGLLSQVVQTVLRVKELGMAIGQPTFNLLHRLIVGVVRGGEPKRLQPACVHRVDHHGGAISKIRNPAEEFQHSVDLRVSAASRVRAATVLATGGFTPDPIEYRDAVRNHYY